MIDCYAAGVFPAHAGMSPITYPGGRIDARFPRTRGDEPLNLSAITVTDQFSPHTRG